MRLKYNFVVNQVGDDFVAIPAGAQVIDFTGILKLNETAAFIVEALNNDLSRDDLVKTVAQKFSCALEDAQENVDYILGGLREAELIIE